MQRVMEDQLDPIFQKAVDLKQVPGVAAVALDRSGKVLFSKGYGHTRLDDPDAPDVTPESPCLMLSCTKLVTCIAALQLIEKRQLSIHDPVAKYVPEIQKVLQLHGFHSDGRPALRPPEKKVLVLHLLTHTSGFTYDTMDHVTLKYRLAVGQTPALYAARSAMEDYMTPLMFEPGSDFVYGISIDWLGMIVERISGQRLADYVDHNILQPLSMRDTGVALTEFQENRFMNIHVKNAKGQLTPTSMRMVVDPEVSPGGIYLYSTCSDYAQLLLTILNNGTHPTLHTTILQSETVKSLLFTDMIPQVGCAPQGIGEIVTSMATVNCEGTFLPGIQKGWSCGFMINNQPLPNGRKEGSGAWSGAGNCYYWIDPIAGKLGFVVCAVMPFFDKQVLHLADALERAVYNKPMAKEVGEAGSNFEGGNFKLD